ncbi:uncharacterized protein LOC119162350 isoform X1 [Rhipicephalus microplus]|uniref:uncharacterized protein LOC119162350 isoform X1 n=1 Tax=Rhipicephalus microplus TaxID=6941 RepID=UPI003F6BDB2D
MVPTLDNQFLADPPEWVRAKSVESSSSSSAAAGSTCQLVRLSFPYLAPFRCGLQLCLPKTPPVATMDTDESVPEQQTGPELPKQGNDSGAIESTEYPEGDNDGRHNTPTDSQDVAPCGIDLEQSLFKVLRPTGERGKEETGSGKKAVDAGAPGGKMPKKTALRRSCRIRRPPMRYQP